jgi:hypothetical protein
MNEDVHIKNPTLLICAELFTNTKLRRRLKGATCNAPKNQPESVGRSATLTIPDLEQSKAAVLNSLASQHSRRSYEYAIERFTAWYCSEPRLTFNRSVVVKYRSFLERLSLSAATTYIFPRFGGWPMNWIGLRSIWAMSAS